MQTFLCSDSFKETAQILDSRRLNKQRVEVLQIYNSLTGKSNGWTHHPAVRMWRGAEQLLLIYGIKMCDECDVRGFADNTRMKDRFYEYLHKHVFHIPSWWADKQTKDAIIRTHQCNLLRKDYEYYKQHFPHIPTSDIFVTDYHWPVK